MTDLFAGASWLADLPREYREPWVLESLWTRSGFNMIVGAPKVRKSYFRRYLMACAMSGQPALGRFPCRDTVKRALVCFGEGPKAAESSANYAIGDSLAVKDIGHRVKVVKPFGFHLDNRQSRADLLALIDGEGFDLVVFDPLLYFHSQDENDASGMSLVCAGLIELAEKACIVVVHHTGKAQPGAPERPVSHSGRGSSALGGAAETLVDFSRVGTTNTHHARFMTRGGQEPENLTITYQTESGMFSAGESDLDQAIIAAVEKEPGISGSKLAQIIGRRKLTVLERVKVLVGTHLSQVWDGETSSPKRLFPIGAVVPTSQEPPEPPKLSC